MKLCKYYSLDECKTRHGVFEELDRLQDDGKIEYSYFDDDEVIKVVDTGLNKKELKELTVFLRENDVVDYPDYEEYYEEEEFLDDDEQDDEDYDELD
jgi:hypothetical protein